MITTFGLTKRYGSVLAVDDVSLDIRTGDIYGFLGANGSGKTTTVRMLLGLVLATSGRIDLMGEAMPKHAGRVLPKIGALVEGPAAYGHLSGKANLTLIDRSGPSSEAAPRAQRVQRALERVGLDGVGRRPVRAYSLGMRQRLGIAAALLRSPELLVLDEPTNGLDPQGIREVRDLLVELNGEGVTVFLSSHLLAEVEQLCTRVGVLDRGRLVLQEQMEMLLRPTGRVVVETPDLAAATAVLGDRVDQRAHDTIIVAGAEVATVNAELVAAGVRVTGLRIERPTLEQVVLKATAPNTDRTSL